MPNHGNAKEPCPGSPTFLAWLAKHNRAQTDLDNSNRVMGWDKRPSARHGVDCGCMGDTPEEDGAGFDNINDLF